MKAPKTGYVNWLKRLDAHSLTLSPPQYWDSWSDRYFFLARYPHLRPSSPPGPDASTLSPDVAKRFFERGKRRFYKLLAEYKREIATHNEGKCALEDLNKDQRQQVAALLLDTIVSFEICAGDAKWKKELGELGREAPSRLSMLKRKINNARTALGDLRNYSGDRHSMMRGKSKGSSWESRNFERAAELCLAILGDVELPKPESFDKELKSFTSSHIRYLRNPAPFNMVRFYWLFRHGCELSGHESEVRVAVIRNAFWRKWTKPVKFRHEYDGVESAGCNAVCLAVKRFKPD